MVLRNYYSGIHKQLNFRNTLEQEPILVVDSDVERCFVFCALLGQENYTTTPLHSPRDLQENILQGGFRVAILNLDVLPVDDHFFRDLKRINPSAIFTALSGRPFHPELKESLCEHIYACIHKPYDPMQLCYWLKTAFINEDEWRNSNLG
jgi:DNA-binding NtrC family response regulator